MTEQRGVLITVEGSDGAGKTTQLEFIETLLRNRGVDLIRTREPGGTPLGETLREILLNERRQKISDEAELLLIFAARQQHIDQVIRPALKAGRWVLCDRFTDASYAYQGAGRGISASRIGVLEQWVQGDLRPDLTLVLDVDVEVGMQRSASRTLDNKPDRFEQQNKLFKKAVRHCYLQRAKAEPDRIRVIDAAATIKMVEQQIGMEINAFLAKREPMVADCDR